MHQIEFIHSVTHSKSFDALTTYQLLGKTLDDREKGEASWGRQPSTVLRLPGPVILSWRSGFQTVPSFGGCGHRQTASSAALKAADVSFYGVTGMQLTPSQAPGGETGLMGCQEEEQEDACARPLASCSLTATPALASTCSPITRPSGLLWWGSQVAWLPLWVQPACGTSRGVERAEGEGKLTLLHSLLSATCSGRGCSPSFTAPAQIG